ncbi:probable protein phosphatase 2C 74 isoform X1 [Vigna umbellata]|uniref:probable protein phosphatase 2C 74 isoform X1 n=1 Tax=Vigna umbellata TaxID=87088 RepID=UPI001F5FAA66|nr:probable protein phosphatase 2C 74 isoform X1 [Vigna umbellata]
MPSPPAGDAPARDGSAPSSFLHKQHQHQRRFPFIFFPGFCCIPRFGYRFSRVIFTESKEKARERWIESLDSLFLISRFHFTVFELRVFSSDSRAFRQGNYCIGGYAIDFALIRIKSDFIAIMTQAVEVLNRYGTDMVGEPRGSDSECLAGFECFLNIVRALGMGSCISEVGAGGSSPPLLSDSNTDGKRRRLRGSSSFDFRVPGRMFSNGSSEVASMFCKQGRKGINQDAMLIWENFCSKEDTIFCGVFDGHGPYGHKVAKKVRDSFPLKLNAQWDLHHKNRDGVSDHSSANGSYKSEGNGFRLVDEKTYPTYHELDETDITLTLKESYLKACKLMDKELKMHPDIDCFCSGTTAVTLVKQGLDLVIGNIGDSRAILGTRDHDDSLIAVQLTVDLKPNLPREEERIRLRRGRVFSLHNEPEVARVWLPNSDFPGLAMARAFGDFCLKDFGLISVPDISYHHLTEKDEFVVLATDGIWDVLSNEEVVDIVASAPRSTAARALVESAVQAWRTKYPFCKVDDCAAVCLFFDPDTDFKSNDTKGKLVSEASVDQSEDLS